MSESSIARRSEWWPGRRMAERFDLPNLAGWFDWPNVTALREGEKLLRIEEFQEDDALVIRSEMPRHASRAAGTELPCGVGTLR